MRVPNDMIRPHVLEYIRGVIPFTEDEILRNLSQRCREEDVPTLEPEAESLLRILLRLRPSRRVLEVGTAYGYSAILMSHYLKEGGTILTIERNEVMWKVAEENILAAGLSEVIDLRKGQAAEILKALQEPYDFILLDASVGQYEEFFREAKRLLNPQGILMADNVLHGGMVAHERLDIPRRQRTIHARMRAFLEDVFHDPEMESFLEPVGDGVLISIKKEEGVL